jgi:hypothetical protein
LYIKNGRNSYKKMDEERLLNTFKQLDDPKAELVFQSASMFDARVHTFFLFNPPF